MSDQVAPGTKFGPYEIVALLGAGGMGQVYRARDSRIRRDVALKILRADTGADASAVRRFEQEARTAAALNHPNIITVHDVGSENGVPYLVCELLEGETLRERLRRGPLPADKAIDIGAQIARGLAAAHARGIVHRDLKPENLFQTRDGVVKLMDFGIAKLRVRDADDAGQQTTMAHTEAGAVIGTAAYMSPEQVAAKPVDHRSDLFSFGVVLYELVTGLRPFTGETSAETMTAILRADPPPMSAVDPKVPAALDRIVTHCLEKDPAQRFQSARDLLFALESLSGTSLGTGGQRSPVSPAQRPHSPWWRGWWLAPAAAVIGGAAVYVAIGLRPPSDVAMFPIATRLAATDATETSPALSPDGKWLAYVAETSGRADIWVRFLSGGEAINLTKSQPLFLGMRGDIGGLDISPDGALIAFNASVVGGTVASQQSVYVMSAPLGGSPRKLIDRGSGLRWSPDGKRVVYVRPGGSAGDSLVVADATGENPREILPVSGGLHTHWPAWSADGKYIYFTQSIVSGNGEPSQIVRVPSTGGPPEVVVATSRRAVHAFPSLDGRGLLYSANPSSVELALFWQPFSGGAPIRLTTGVGEYSDARMSADGRTIVAAAYDVKRSIESVIVAASSTQAAMVPVTPGFSGEMDPAVSIAGDRLAFASSRAGGRNLWTSALDGSDAQQVTSGPDLDERPAWSPDGSQLAFVSSRGGTRGIWTVGRDGGAPHHVANAQVLDVITWSPDGRELVYAAPDGDVPHLFRVAASGGSTQRLATPGPAVAPSWSAARNLIAYIEAAQPVAMGGPGPRLAFINAAGQPPTDIHVQSPLLSNGTVAWSTDGHFIAGYADPGGALGSLWVIDVTGSTPPRLIIELPVEQRLRGITWAPGNSRVLFGLQTRTSDIVLLDRGR